MNSSFNNNNLKSHLRKNNPVPIFLKKQKIEQPLNIMNLSQKKKLY